MIRDVKIRAALDEDAKAIHVLTRDAFAPMSFADENDQHLPARLQADGDLTLSLVAVTDKIIGHVAFSPVTIANARGDWYALGPISVLAAHQRQGIGTLLAKTGLAQLRDIGAAGCVLTGNPDVYGPMGFSNDHALTYGGLNPRFISYLTLSGSIPKGEITFAPALQENHT
ncbi:N-acetyltransferase [Yoonia sp. F2084L]|uniref:GNAT family N-acetyltransferase n=1 Tax=Yoonia sp. F2084L TaxID=2926419 RepID=UPI001FF2B6D3|nr:N-acetyltransferase [Yoonia sp. F2084L]MCK0095699.1 N-acetyltransferase [Yoonia sp. F2084L]